MNNHPVEKHRTERTAQGKHPVSYLNVPIAGKGCPDIKDNCSWCGKPCDSEFVSMTSVERYNSRGNACISCDSSMTEKKKVIAPKPKRESDYRFFDLETQTIITQE